jgi:hypothetical protein
VTDGAPTLWDLQRLIERNHTDSRDDIIDLKAQVARDAAALAAQMERFVLREVYEARESAMLQRISALEEAAKTSRTAVRNAVYAAAGSVIATVLAAVIMAVIFKGGKP